LLKNPKFVISSEARNLLFIGNAREKADSSRLEGVRNDNPGVFQQAASESTSS
jgi:hypothetical protein